MTTAYTRPVSRVLPVIDRRTRRHWCIMIEGPVVRMWLKGCRRAGAYVVPVELIANLGARIRAQEIKDRKAAERKARRLTTSG